MVLFSKDPAKMRDHDSKGNGPCGVQVDVFGMLDQRKVDNGSHCPRNVRI